MTQHVECIQERAADMTLAGQLFLLRDRKHQGFITVSTGIGKGKMPASIKGGPVPLRAFWIRTKYSLKRIRGQ
jgi:hypothetical protein